MVNALVVNAQNIAWHEARLRNTFPRSSTFNSQFSTSASLAKSMPQAISLFTFKLTARHPFTSIDNWDGRFLVRHLEAQPFDRGPHSERAT